MNQAFYIGMKIIANRNARLVGTFFILLSQVW